jgi:hypothetical protein
MSEMNKGVEILIGRMESHPQEFQHDVMRGEYGRWANVLAQVMQGDIFSEEERAAVQQALRTTRREQFTKRVIQQLMADPTAATQGMDTVHGALKYKYATPNYAKETTQGPV